MNHYKSYTVHFKKSIATEIQELRFACQDFWSEVSVVLGRLLALITFQIFVLVLVLLISLSGFVGQRSYLADEHLKNCMFHLTVRRRKALDQTYPAVWTSGNQRGRKRTLRGDTAFLNYAEDQGCICRIFIRFTVKINK